MDGDMKRAIERDLRLNEFSVPLDSPIGRPFVVTTGSGMNPRPQEIYATNQTLAASKAGPVPPYEITPETDEIPRGSPQDEDQQP
jgi:hypothetical protein